MLIKGLPDMLRREYEHDEPLVRSGKHLFFSPFFQVASLQVTNINY